MSVAQVRNKRSLAFTIAFAMLLALVVPFAGVALANHSGVDNSHTLEITEETDTNALGTTHTLTAVIGLGNCTGTCEVDFEIESGPAVRVSCVQGGTGDVCTGGTASDTDNSPTTPDMTCTTTGTGCTVTFTSDTSGENIIRAWVDDNKDNSNQDADLTEGRDENAAGQGGTRTEPDDTDVVSKTWFTAAAGDARLDCDDESGNDDQINPAGQTEVYTCRAWIELGGTANQFDSGTDTAITGMRIDAESSGANDPDNRAFNDTLNTTADFNDACTTASDGTCTYTLAASEGEIGTATVCFWLDEDTDTAFSNTGGTSIDGSECNGEAFADAEGTNRTDVVQKQWAAPAPVEVDASPEVDNNASGTSHTVSALVTDQFSNPFANAPVTFEIRAGSKNAALGTICTNVPTNSSGVSTCTYTDALATTSGTDTIEVYTAAGAGDANTETRATDDNDLADVVSKIWTVGGPPAAASVIVDMNPANGCDDTADSIDLHEVGTDNAICGEVRSSTTALIPGAEVELTISGPGEFGSDANANGVLDAGEGQGQSITVTTDEAGRWDATLFSTQTGDATITATAGSATDTGTKTWQTVAAGARVVDCTPEEASNASGTEHIVLCTVTDRYGNGVPGVGVTVSETGVGRIDSGGTGTTDANGQVETVLTTTSTEEGTQTITGSLTIGGGGRIDATGTNDACEQVAGDVIASEPGPTVDDPAAPAGVCSDTVTKDWVEPVPPGGTECSDQVDNDGDGDVDLDDAGCSNAADDSEDTDTPRACRGVGDAIVGTSGNDVLNGTAGPDVICGAGGDDVINARGGADLVTGNSGDDVIGGAGGRDNLSGNGGNDNVSGGGKSDAIKGGAGNDTLKGNKGVDSLTGGGGNDSLQGAGAGDILKGGKGRDTLRGGKGPDLLDGGPGRDQCFGGPGRDRIRNCE